MMKANEILVEVMANTVMQDGKKYTQTRMAEELSQKSEKKVTLAAVNDRLKNENIKISNFIEMLDLLGYVSTSRLRRTDIAFLTVFGISCNLRSRKMR